MVQNNKILTVSYGTFSCTLEGFDDSFGTMKAIAEYFRDLAADDRYFGAEPPVPDAEMLARIAEREIARRVEAHLDSGGIVLRAGSNMIGNAEEDSKTQATENPPEAKVSAPEVAEPAVDEESEAAEAFNDPVKTDPQESAAEPQTEEVQTEPTVADTAAPVVESADDTPDDTPVAEIMEPVATPQPAEPDSIAAKLARIRAVVAKQAAPRGDYIEDQHAENFLTSEAEAISELIGEEVETAADETVELGEGIEVASEVAEPEEVVSPSADEAEETAEDVQTVETTAEDVDAAAHDADTDTQDQADEDDREDEILAAALSKLDALDARQGLFSDDEDEDDEDDDDLRNILADDEPAQPQPKPAPRAHVVKVSREDFERAMAQAKVDKAEDITTDQADEDQDGALHPEAEDALLRELAQIEADIGSETAAPASASEPQTEDQAKRGPARSALPDPVEEEEAVSRLLAETESKLEEPEASRRREEFVQMRAAVAAREADGDSKGPTEDPETEYRRDLETAVRPRRPDAAPTTRSTRPNVERIPPLKLVAEQRVDTPDRAAAAEQPVRPRRVPSPMQLVAEDEAADGRTTFREFADSVGAHDLPEMLEAAAAYLSIVEGLEEFTRPQVMNKIRAIKADEFSREDGLRSFGQLLREGKIAKTRSGRFTTSEAIGYQPEARAAG